jgi:HK97 family phage major capsid protein
MKINTRDLSQLVQEMNSLSNKVHHNDQEKRRYAFLQTATAAVGKGASLEALDYEYVNGEEQRMGLPITVRNPFAGRDKQAEARGWKNFLEKRDMTAGDAKARIGTYTSLGFFTPTDYFPTLFSALGAHDVLFNEDDCTLVRSTNGRPLTVPTLGDIEVVAGIVGEAGSQSSVNFSVTGQASVGVYTYNSKRIVVSLEAFQDASEALSIMDITKATFASRLARAIGTDLLVGNGVNKPLGLLTALGNLGVTPVIAQGSSANDGSTNSGNNSIGQADFANTLAALDSAYLDSPKTAWILNRKTLGFVNALTDKMGQPLHLVKYDVNMQPYIMGVPVKISPSMPNIGPSTTPVVIADLSYWMSRLVMDDNTGLKSYVEGPGLIEQGNVGIGCFVRAGGALLYNDTSSPAPAAILQCHS